MCAVRRQATCAVFAQRVQQLTATLLEISRACGCNPAPQMPLFRNLIDSGTEVRLGCSAVYSGVRVCASVRVRACAW